MFSDGTICCELGDCDRPATGQDELGTWLCDQCAEAVEEATYERTTNGSRTVDAPTREHQR